MPSLLTRHQIGILAGRGPAYRLPAFQAARDYGCGLVLVQHRHRRFSLPGREVLIGIVEDQPLSRGPTGFDLLSLAALVRSVHGAVVLIGDPATWLYDRTAALAGQGVSTLLVETTPAHGCAWVDFIHATAPAVATALIPICTRRHS